MRWLFLCLTALAIAACSKSPQEADYADLEWKSDVYHLGEQPFTGIARASYDDGAKKGEYPFVNGRFHGVVREWWPNGVQSVETHFEHGKRNGSNRYWSQSGTLTKEQIYDNDKSVSVKHFDEDSQEP